MSIKNKNTIILILLLSASPVFAQINTYSPYSRFGLGELYTPGLAQNSGLGASGVALRSNTHINYLNPASYTAIDTLSFVFDFGLSGYTTNYSDGENSERINNFNIHHIAIGFPITRWMKAAAGIVPYSTVGYNILEEGYLQGYGPVDYYYSGNGGLNKLFLGTSVELFKRLSLGANMSYMFGFLEYSSRTSFPLDENAAVTAYEERLDVNSILFNFGLQYRQTFNEKYFITLGVTLDNESGMNTNRLTLQQQRYPGIPDSTYVSAGDSARKIFIPTLLNFNRNEKEGEITYPRNIGVGLAFGIQNRLTISGEYTMQEWSNTNIFGRSDSLVNSNSIRGGIEVTPDPEALRGYFNHVAYRLGAYYSNSYLRIHGEQLKDYGITFGVRLPFRGTRSAINLGFVIGQRGTLDNNLIKENYGIFNLGVTLQDYWFHKRKID